MMQVVLPNHKPQETQIIEHFSEKSQKKQKDDFPSNRIQIKKKIGKAKEA